MKSRAIERLVKHLARWSYGLLLALIVYWEAWGAPATPVSRGFWLALKGLPLLVAIPDLWRNSAQAHVLATLLVLIYFCEGVASVYGAAISATYPALAYGAAEIVLSVVFIGAASFHARFIRRRVTPRAGAETGS